MLIEARHRIPLETAVSNSAPGHRVLAQNLYLCALREYTGQHQEEPENFWIYRVEGKSAVTVMVTDMDTGYFVQMQGSLKGEGPFLTFGKKLLAETKNDQLQNTAVKIWR